MRELDSKDQDISKRAAWFVTRLYSGEMTAAEEAELNIWLTAGPDHRAEYDMMLALWDNAEGLKGDIDILAAGHADSAAPRLPHFIWNLRSIAAVCAVVFSISLLLIGTLGPPTENRHETFETAVGEQRAIVLEDGSNLMLNTGSRVLIDFTPSKRRVILDYGEAFFDVAKDPDRPMIVAVGGRDVTVLGTQFNVLLAGKEVKVAVVEGTVAVSPRDTRFPMNGSDNTQENDVGTENSLPSGFSLEESVGKDGVVLQAGSIAVFRGEQQQVTVNSSDIVERIQSWRGGVIRFDGEPLYRVVGEINRYSRSKVLIEDSSIMNLTISGVFKPGQVDMILMSLEDIHPIEVVRHPDRYVLVGLNSSSIRSGSERN
jgi:transmembrane sensor